MTNHDPTTLAGLRDMAKQRAGFLEALEAARDRIATRIEAIEGAEILQVFADEGTGEIWITFKPSEIYLADGCNVRVTVVSMHAAGQIARGMLAFRETYRNRGARPALTGLDTLAADIAAKRAETGGAA